MIVGLDHIAIGAESLNFAQETLAVCGYHCVFEQRHLENRCEKFRFLHAESLTHDIAIFHASTARHLPIEVTVHTKLHVVQAPLLISHWRCPQAHISRLRQLAGPGSVITPADSDPGLQGVSIASVDINYSMAFWTGAIGMRAVNGQPQMLAHASPVPRWNWQLQVMPAACGTAFTMLDDSGPNAIALLSTDIASDCNLAMNAGATDLTPPFTLTVNKKPLKLALLRSPEGLMIELIEIQRSR